jgi:hypothetical protein
MDCRFLLALCTFDLHYFLGIYCFLLKLEFNLILAYIVFTFIQLNQKVLHAQLIITATVIAINFIIHLFFIILRSIIFLFLFKLFLFYLFLLYIILAKSCNKFECICCDLSQFILTIDVTLFCLCKL